MTYVIHSSLIVSRSGLVLVAWKYFVVFTAVVPFRHNMLLRRLRRNPTQRRYVGVRCDHPNLPLTYRLPDRFVLSWIGAAALALLGNSIAVPDAILPPPSMESCSCVALDCQLPATAPCVALPSAIHACMVGSSRASDGPNKIILFGGFRFAPPTLHLNY